MSFGAREVVPSVRPFARLSMSVCLSTYLSVCPVVFHPRCGGVDGNHGGRVTACGGSSGALAAMVFIVVVMDDGGGGRGGGGAVVVVVVVVVVVIECLRWHPWQ